MAVLEAFVYDPLLNWRLIDGMSYFTLVTFVGCSSTPSPSSLLLLPPSTPKNTTYKIGFRLLGKLPGMVPLSDLNGTEDIVVALSHDQTRHRFHPCC